MDCHDVRDHLLDFQRGQLGGDVATEVRRHIDGCVECAQADLVERELTLLLERRTPQYPAPIGLKRRLMARWPSAPGAGTNTRGHGRRRAPPPRARDVSTPLSA